MDTDSKHNGSEQHQEHDHDQHEKEQQQQHNQNENDNHKQYKEMRDNNNSNDNDQQAKEPVKEQVKDEDITSKTYILTDIDNVPELMSVTPIQALSYLNQSLENLILVYQSTSSFRSNSEGEINKAVTPDSTVAANSMGSGTDCTNQDAATTENNSNDNINDMNDNNNSDNNGNNSDSNNHNDNEDQSKAMSPNTSPQTESELESVASPLSKSSSKSSSNSSSSSSLVNTIKAATLSSYNNNSHNKPETSQNENGDENSNDGANGMSNISNGSEGSSSSSSSNNTTTENNNTNNSLTPHAMPALTPKNSHDTSAILEEAAVVAAVVIEGAEQRRRSSGVLIPMESRICSGSRRVSELATSDEIPYESHESGKSDNSSESNNEKNENSSENESSEVAVVDSDGSTSATPLVTSPTLSTSNTSTSMNPTTITAHPSLVSANRPAVSIQEMEEKGQIIKRFWSKNAPPISIWDYLLRIQKFTPMSTSVYLSASLYIYRLCIELRTILLTPLSVHRIILASLRIACKVIEDLNYKQARFAATGGVKPVDLYRLEIAFLFLIDFDVAINSTVLQDHMVMLTELDIQANRHRQLLSRKRQRSCDSAQGTERE